MNRGTINIPVVGLILKAKDAKVLFVLRQHTGWMDGYYMLPGGHVEEGESFSQAICREAHEELGIELKQSDLKHAITNQYYYDEGVRVSITFIAESWTATPINNEPDRHSEIAWFDPGNLPDNVVSKNLLENIAAGKNYIENGWSNV
jgi:8-oxo-dGTP diphosphatase